jgi:hypothetical protein
MSHHKAVALKNAGVPRAVADESRDYRLRAMIDQLVRENASEREITRTLRSMNG